MMINGEPIFIVEQIGNALAYIESNLQSGIDSFHMEEEICRNHPHLKKAFESVVGYRIKTYIDNRRLFLAAQDVVLSDEKLLSLASKYGMDDSTLSRAFRKFHSLSISQLKKNPALIHTFPPFNLNHIMSRGNVLLPEFITCSFPAITAFSTEIHWDNSEKEILNFKKTVADRLSKDPVALSSYVYPIDHFGIIIEHTDNPDYFNYSLGLPFQISDSEKTVLFTTSHALWAKFTSYEDIISMPDFIRAVFSSWARNYELNYEICQQYIIEHYIYDYIQKRFIQEIYLPVREIASGSNI